MIKSFRGKLDVGGQDRIRLSTKQGLIGYRVVKFQLMDENPMGTDIEGVAKVFKTKQTTVDQFVDFTDPNMLAAGFYENATNIAYFGGQNVIFDTVKFNQDIFITYHGTTATVMNYYIELEQMKLDLNEATVATLKDMRGRE